LFKGHIGIINAFKVKERERKTVLNRGDSNDKYGKKIKRKVERR
jgi:hypothetical protein